MAIFRVEKTRNYTVMSNHHLRNKSLPLKAKGLLSLILSLPDNWDYSMKGLAAISYEGIDAIRQAVGDLEKHGYVVRSRVRDAKGHLRGMEYVIYEQPQMRATQPKLDNPAQDGVPDAVDTTTIPAQPEPDHPTSDAPALALPTVDQPILDYPILDNPALEDPTQLSTKERNTYPNQVRTAANPYQSYPSHQDQRVNSQERIGLDEIRYAAANVYREAIQKRIGYDVLVQGGSIEKERLDEIVEIMLEIFCATGGTVMISGKEYEIATVQDRFQQINSQHIQYIFECMDQNTRPVRNIKGYLVAVLFNATSTMNAYYAARLNEAPMDMSLDDYVL